MSKSKDSKPISKNTLNQDIAIVNNKQRTIAEVTVVRSSLFAYNTKNNIVTVNKCLVYLLWYSFVTFVALLAQLTSLLPLTHFRQQLTWFSLSSLPTDFATVDISRLTTCLPHYAFIRWVRKRKLTSSCDFICDRVPKIRWCWLLLFNVFIWSR